MQQRVNNSNTIKGYINQAQQSQHIKLYVFNSPSFRVNCAKLFKFMSLSDWYNKTVPQMPE